MSSTPDAERTATIRAALEFHRSWARMQHEESADPYYVEIMAEIDSALDTLAAGQDWTPVDLELYEYPDGKKGLVYTSSDGYGRAQLRYLQDADTDTPRETIIILPDHLRLCKLAQQETTDAQS